MQNKPVIKIFHWTGFETYLIRGDTYKVKEKLKSAGFKWSSEDRWWITNIPVESMDPFTAAEKVKEIVGSEVEVKVQEFFEDAEDIEAEKERVIKCWREYVEQLKKIKKAREVVVQKAMEHLKKAAPTIAQYAIELHIMPEDTTKSVVIEVKVQKVDNETFHLMLKEGKYLNGWGVFVVKVPELWKDNEFINALRNSHAYGGVFKLDNA
jgi:uncharacterized protein YdaU (DUF1376 family)